jgi:Mrp family chromosome partitioning ATPase
VASRAQHDEPSASRLLEVLPGIDEVVWSMITRLAGPRVPTRVLFTAAEERAGNTMLAAATAGGIARHLGLPVCLLETNVLRPSLSGYLGIERTGLSDLLDGRAALEDCLHEPTDCPGLLVLPAGTPRDPRPGEFASGRMIATLAVLAQRCHYFIMDTAPVLGHIESRLLLRHVDAAVLVLRARATRRADAERTNDILVASGTPVLGSIFNDSKVEGFAGGNRRANRAFELAARAERPRASAVLSMPRQAAASVEAGASQGEQEGLVSAPLGKAPGANGNTALLAPAAPTAGSDEAAHRRRIDQLERRIAKLTQQLEQTEAELKRIAAMKSIDLGIASIYRSVQGLSARDEALALKRSLMRDIFQANLNLRTAMARHS